jgi:hypothetical protein
MGSFLDSLQQNASKNARTENGALTHSTTHNAVLDFFALAGGMRDNAGDAVKLFRKAFAEDPQLAVRALFYIRDIRGGQGERDLFRTLFLELRTLDDEAAEQVTGFIPEYGRWDDLLTVADPELVAEIVSQQLEIDTSLMDQGQSISLMAKWLPSENASSEKSRKRARLLADLIGMSNKEYRQRVVALRKYIQLLEQKMSANEWEAIDYGKLPSQAGRKHNKAFKRHDENRYSSYLEAVMSGDAKMNAGTLYTYEVFDEVKKGNDKAADAMWKSLPDWTNGSNSIVVADVSGSMFGRPMSVSVSLALYFAEHNTGPFKDYFLTFSTRPHLVKVQGKTLTERLRNIESSDWGMNTDLNKVFDLILRAAVSSGADAEDVPKVIYIISDMEFDEATGNRWDTSATKTNYERAEQMFVDAGFELPHIVFWNVNARNTNVPATLHDGKVTLISGLSQSTFRYVVEGKTPLELMHEVLNGERYAQITV